MKCKHIIIYPSNHVDDSGYKMAEVAFISDTTAVERRKVIDSGMITSDDIKCIRFDFETEEDPGHNGRPGIRFWSGDKQRPYLDINDCYSLDIKAVP